MTPPFLYGTAWKEERTEALTSTALSAGFRGFDTANQRKHYFEAAVGAALTGACSRGLVRRGDLFLQSKFTFASGQDHRLPYDPRAALKTQVAQSFQSTLEHFRTDYLDSYLLHGPSSRDGLNAADYEAWGAFEDLLEAGKVRFLGVSNVSAAQLRLLLSQAKHKPKFVQNRCYARTGWDRECRAICQSEGVIYQGFSLLTANRSELKTPAVERIAQRLGATVPQVVFRFALSLGMLPLTGTSDAEHMKQDLASVDLELTVDDMRTLGA